MIGDMGNNEGLPGNNNGEFKAGNSPLPDVEQGPHLSSAELQIQKDFFTQFGVDEQKAQAMADAINEHLKQLPFREPKMDEEVRANQVHELMKLDPGKIGDKLGSSYYGRMMENVMPTLGRTSEEIQLKDRIHSAVGGKLVDSLGLRVSTMLLENIQQYEDVFDHVEWGLGVVDRNTGTLIPIRQYKDQGK